MQGTAGDLERTIHASVLENQVQSWRPQASVIISNIGHRGPVGGPWTAPFNVTPYCQYLSNLAIFMLAGENRAKNLNSAHWKAGA